MSMSNKIKISGRVYLEAIFSSDHSDDPNPVDYKEEAWKFLMEIEQLTNDAFLRELKTAIEHELYRSKVLLNKGLIKE